MKPIYIKIIENESILKKDTIEKCIMSFFRQGIMKYFKNNFIEQLCNYKMTDYFLINET